MELIPLFSEFGWPSLGVAVVVLLLRVNHTLEGQRHETRELFHALDKRLTVMESKGGGHV